ncbi:winged helix-turn-helix domain-containing protein [Micromonospora schwarzwaldensis]|uniref:winged helix-turn-helix domain-containing protein n=1 Tax=Micromonospora sp. DSM 45708 TaxID=3111767 RepID=UPI0031CF42CC
MVYRIHFTIDDLARTRMVESPRPLTELVLAAWALRRRSQPARLAAWRQQVVTRLPARARMVFDLAPIGGYTPCFLSPTRPVDVKEQLEWVRRTPRSRIDDQMTRFAEHRPVPGWARRLGDDPTVLQQLVDTLGELHGTMIEPYWPQVEAQVAADKAVRGRDLLDGGLNRLLSGLCPPLIRWAPPVLHVATASRADLDLHLGGRGLLLIPSVFGHQSPTVSDDVAGDVPCLSYPVGYRGAPLGQVGQTDDASRPPTHVAALLGRTRATILHAVAERPGRSTNELAAATGVSPSTASEHATVLRTAGLIVTARRRQTALHVPTQAGMSLLQAAPGHDHANSREADSAAR